MYQYNIYGLKVETDYKLEECVCSAFDRADITIRVGKIDSKLHEELEEEKGMKTGHYYHYEKTRGWIRSSGQVIFVIQEGTTIEYELLKGYDDLAVRSAILCLAIPVALLQRSIIMIHGSGICWKNKCFIISGQSGSGKSTLADRVLMEDAKFLADDTVVLKVEADKIFAECAYPQRKICEHQITEEMLKKYDAVKLPFDGDGIKYGIRCKEEFEFDHHTLDALLIIEKDATLTEPKLIQVTGADKIKYLIQNLYKYEAYLTMGLRVEAFKQCVQIANEIDIYRLIRPVKGNTIEELKDMVELIVNQ